MLQRPSCYSVVHVRVRAGRHGRALGVRRGAVAVPHRRVRAARRALRRSRRLRGLQRRVALQYVSRSPRDRCITCIQPSVTSRPALFRRGGVLAPERRVSAQLHRAEGGARVLVPRGVARAAPAPRLHPRLPGRGRVRRGQALRPPLQVCTYRRPRGPASREIRPVRWDRVRVTVVRIPETRRAASCAPAPRGTG